MFYEFRLEGQNKIIFNNALADAKNLLDLSKDSYNTHIKLAPNHEDTEETLASSFQFFQDLYDWLDLLKNEQSLKLTKKNFLDFAKNYRGYGKNIDAFLNLFQEVTDTNINTNSVKTSKNLQQQAMLTYHYSSQLKKSEHPQDKTNNPSLTTSRTNKITPK